MEYYNYKKNYRGYIAILSYKGQITKKPEEVSAALLTHIKNKVQEYQGKSLTEVVITYPAGFTVEQMSATREAAKIAGWKTINLLPEPIAASFAYYIDRPLKLTEMLLLFDLGGGTLDVCILEIQNDQIQIISREGDLELGGRDFDRNLIEHHCNLLMNMTWQKET